MSATSGTRWNQIKSTQRHGAALSGQSSDNTGADGHLGKFNAGVLTDNGNADCYGVDTGAANAYAIALTPAITLQAGDELRFKVGHTNTGASTLALNAGPAIAIKKKDGVTDLASGDWTAGQIVEVIYDGTHWQWIGGAGSSGGSSVGASSTTGSTTPGSFVQSRLSQVDNTGSLAFNSANTAGNCLVVATRYGADSGSVTDSQGNTYTLIQSFSNGNGYTKCWIAPNCNAGANTVHLSGLAAQFFIGEIAGVALTSPVDVSTQVTEGNLVSPATPSVTTTIDNDYLLLVAGGANVSTAPTQTGSYSAIASGAGQYGGTYQNLAVWAAQAGAAGSYSNTVGNMNGGVGFLIALKAGSTSTTTTNVTTVSTGGGASLTSGQLLVGAGGGVIATGNLSGDVTTSGSTATTLANSGVSAGSYTNPNLTVDAKGRITAASNGAGSVSAWPSSLFTTPPAVASLAWINQGGATAVDQSGGIYMVAPAGGSDNLRCLVKSSYPSTPYTFTVGVALNFRPGNNYFLGGIVITDGTKYVTLGIGTNTTVSSQLPVYAVHHWSSLSAVASASANSWLYPCALYWLRVTDNGTNFTFSISYNGIDFSPTSLVTESRTAYLSSPTKVGVFVDANNASYGISGHFVSWSGI